MPCTPQKNTLQIKEIHINNLFNYTIYLHNHISSTHTTKILNLYAFSISSILVCKAHMVYLSIKALVNDENIIYNLLTPDESIMKLRNYLSTYTTNLLEEFFFFTDNNLI